jgi:hypothetical protein
MSVKIKSKKVGFYGPRGRLPTAVGHQLSWTGCTIKRAVCRQIVNATIVGRNLFRKGAIGNSRAKGDGTAQRELVAAVGRVCKAFIKWRSIGN